MIGFVVLHYQDTGITEKSISCLMQLSPQSDIQIVLVDNGSPNHSGEVLKEKYAAVSNVRVIINVDNLGFARGNNAGYLKCKEIGCDIIVVMNNDVMIYQQDFVSRLYKNIDRADIVAPDVLNLEHVHCNPITFPPISAESMHAIKKDAWLRYALYSVPILNKKLIQRHFSSPTKIEAADVNGWESEQHNIVPHGCCVIYNRHWIENVDFAFVPITFMYAEEHILYTFCSRNNYTIFYDPSIQIVHHEAVTTNARMEQSKFKEAIASRKRYYKWHIDAVDIYFRYLKALRASLWVENADFC